MAIRVSVSPAGLDSTVADCRADVMAVELPSTGQACLGTFKIGTRLTVGTAVGAGPVPLEPDVAEGTLVDVGAGLGAGVGASVEAGAGVGVGVGVGAMRVGVGAATTALGAGVGS